MTDVNELTLHELLSAYESGILDYATYMDMLRFWMQSTEVLR